MASTVQIGDITCGPGEIQFGGIPSVYLRDGSVMKIPPQMTVVSTTYKIHNTRRY